ncbi:MAG: hypothetical protein AB7V26_06915 [Lysobacterales bacterium]
MILDTDQQARLKFLARVVRKESQHLASTDQRLFADAFNLDRASELDHDPDLAERVEAVVGRFGRLQDTLGDKLLPALLSALGEKASASIDNLDRAERLGLMPSVEQWMTIRNLRNKMVHEYVEDPAVLVGALQSGHAFVLELIATGERMLAEIVRRGWA